MRSLLLAFVALMASVAIGVAASDLLADHQSRLRHHGMARRYSNKHSSGNNNQNQPSDDYLVVKTNEGRVRGHFNHTSGAYSWLGVPFGADTGGSNRFRPPKPVANWDDVKDATKYGPSCPQHGSGGSVKAVGLFGLSPSIFDRSTQSEDCLNANIFVGKKHWENYVKSGGQGKKAPVWLNIYGGSYEWGANKLEMYEGDRIVTQDDVVVISVNFRNWIFGYPQSPQLDVSRHYDDDDYPGANPGMNDVDFAIEWVYKNIEHFGGDPDKITMGGTSTGACTVDNWAYAHYQKPTSKYIKGLILQSGSMTSLGRYFVAPDGADFTKKTGDWNRVAKEVGCGTASDDAQFRCMQHKPWEDIMDATFSTDAKFLLAVDNKTVFSDYYQRLEEKRYVDIPMLIGNNKDEGNAFLIHDAYLTDVAGPVVTSEVWVCPAGVQAKERQGVAPTWRYRFSPSFYLPGMPWEYRELLTFHGSDTPYAWGTWPQLRYIGNQTTGDPGPVFLWPWPTDDFETRKAVAEVYRGVNVEFVKDPENGLYSFHGGWPTYTPDKPSIGDIGYGNSPKFRLISSSDVDGLCPLTNAEVSKNNMKWKPTVQRIRGFIV